MTKNKWLKRGFSLIELSVVNVTIALLMTLALPRLNRALNRARIVEAVTTCSTIERMMLDYYNRTGQYPAVEGEQNPPQPPSAGRVLWDDTSIGWKELGFKGDGAAYRYRYTFKATPDGAGRYTNATIHAWADVDNNGIDGEYIITLQDGARVKDILIDE
jgi:type II secretory pathway pseudopilin PulG